WWAPAGVAICEMARADVSKKAARVASGRWPARPAARGCEILLDLVDNGMERPPRFACASSHRSTGSGAQRTEPAFVAGDSGRRGQYFGSGPEDLRER